MEALKEGYEWVDNPPEFKPVRTRTVMREVMDLRTGESELRPYRVAIPPDPPKASDWEPERIQDPKDRHRSPISVHIFQAGEAKCLDCRKVFHAEVTGERCLCPRCQSPRILI